MDAIIDITFIDPVHGELHVVVSSPSGGGGSYQVCVNDYFKGPIVCTTKGWISYVKLDVLTQDDIDAILDKINELYPCG